METENSKNERCWRCGGSGFRSFTETMSSPGHPCPACNKKTLMERLAEIAPKREEKVCGEQKLTAFRYEPILLHAQLFANWVAEDLPKNQGELRDLLWVFGTQLSGDMEKRMNHAMNLANDMVNLRVPAIIFEGEKK